MLTTDWQTELLRTPPLLLQRDWHTSDGAPCFCWPSGVAGLSADLGPWGVWRDVEGQVALQTHLAAWRGALQQVSHSLAPWRHTRLGVAGAGVTTRNKSMYKSHIEMLTCWSVFYPAAGIVQCKLCKSLWIRNSIKYQRFHCARPHVTAICSYHSRCIAIQHLKVSQHNDTVHVGRAGNYTKFFFLFILISVRFISSSAWETW